MEACQFWQASLLDSTPMRDLLVRYLLGELNSQEQEQLEAQLRDSPEMRRELEYLRACLPGGGSDADVKRPRTDDTPTGLAERTLGRIHGGEPDEGVARSPAEVAAAYDRPAGTPSWSLADLTVAGGVFLAISMLFLPALRQSRDAARRNGCANNLRQLGVMLESSSGQHGWFFPQVTRHDNAGVFAVYLLEEQHADRDELARLLVCRSSQLAQDVAEKRVFIRVPTMRELEAATAIERCVLNRYMGGDYAYLLGFVEGDHHYAVRNEHSCRKAVLADAPSQMLNNLMSANHGGCGQNVLFQDGHVCYQKKSSLPENQRGAIYLNDAGEEAAGLDRDDTVLGRSETTPGGVGLKLAP
jgi:hypothetical protein